MPESAASQFQRSARKKLGAELVARVIAKVSHAETGIDIHPGARIGQSFFVDHGIGIVISEAAVIGERVRLYQGVTLGGEPSVTGAARHAGEAFVRRHPVIGGDVVIFPGAVLLGPITIGARGRIGGNVWLRSDVLPDHVVEAPAPDRPCVMRRAGTIDSLAYYRIRD